MDADWYTFLAKLPIHLSLHDMPESVTFQNGDLLILFILQSLAGILLTRITLLHLLELFGEEKQNKAKHCWLRQTSLLARFSLKAVCSTLACTVAQIAHILGFPGGAVVKNPPAKNTKRIRLPMQETRVRALVQEDPTCRGATKPMRHNY